VIQKRIVETSTIVLFVLVVFMIIVVPRIGDDKEIDYSIVGTVYEVEDFEPDIKSDDFGTWIDRVESFMAISTNDDSVTERNFHRIEWVIIEDQAPFVVRPRLDSLSKSKIELVAVIDIPVDIYEKMISVTNNSI